MNQLAILNARPNELTAVLHPDVFDRVPGDVTASKDVARWTDFREKYHRAQRLDDHFDFPLQLDVELNSTCNLSCSFCTHGYEKVEPRTLSWEDFCRVVDEGQDHGLCSIKMNGINEPLLLPGFTDHVRYAKDGGVLNVYFATNGVMLNERIARDLIDARASKIMVSLDAATHETFKAMRQSEKFDLIRANIVQLISIRNGLGVSWPMVRVNFLKTALNVHEAEEFSRQWEGVADSIGFQTQLGVPGVSQELLPYQGNYGRDGEPFHCSMPFKLVGIDAKGNINPCCTWAGKFMPIGHVSTSTVKRAWDGPEMAALKEMHRTVGHKGSTVCVACIDGKGLK